MISFYPVHYFGPPIKYYIKCVTPLVKVVRLVDFDEKPTMPYIYEMMDRANKAIAKNLDNVQSRTNQFGTKLMGWNLHLHL